MTAAIHPSCIVEGDVELAEGVRIGPGCTIRGPVRIGPHTELLGSNFLHGPLELGAGNVLYPNAHLGFAPQSLRYDPHHPGRGLVIGDRNIFREGVTVHRAMTEEGPTRIGNSNYFMTNAHLGHDGQVGHHCVFASGALLGGHVVIGDRVVLGGNAGVHQFVRVGRGAMISGAEGATLDVPPWWTLTTTNVAGSLNLVGLRRSGASREDVDDVRWGYAVVCRRGLSIPNALEALRERAGRPLIDELIAFIAARKRGIATARPRRAHGPGAPGADAP